MNKQNIAKAMPTVLFITGIAGIFVSEVMAARDTLKAEKILKDEVKVKMADDDKPEPYCDNAKEVILCPDKPTYIKNVVKVTWKCYVPTLVSTTLTVGMLLASKKLTTRQIALLSSAVASTGGLITRYRDEIREKFDEATLKDIDKAVAEKEIQGDTAFQRQGGTGAAGVC